jgi:hypothetical protein
MFLATERSREHRNHKSTSSRGNRVNYTPSPAFQLLTGHQSASARHLPPNAPALPREEFLSPRSRIKRTENANQLIIRQTARIRKSASRETTEGHPELHGELLEFANAGIESSPLWYFRDSENVIADIYLSQRVAANDDCRLPKDHRFRVASSVRLSASPH